MSKIKKICFVIMGFGRKTDPSTGKTLDLDKTYKNIIQPAVEQAGFQCVRADEIQDSGLIDKSMYALLMHADLVVADISTYNPNAIYELGIRHAVRPFTTIVIKEQDGRIPFDLDHTRIFHYAHLGEDIGADEAQRCQQALLEMIERTTRNSIIDSPLYDFIKDINPPKLPATEYKRIIGDLAEREKHIFAIVEKAKNHMEASEFTEAANLWGRACEIATTESYFVQQHALALYKSKFPTELSALSDALRVIERLVPDGDTNDPETLGLTGAIYKRMWLITRDPEYLRRAINYYGKGFQIRNDHYTGENYALCLNMMADIETDNEEKIYNLVAAKKARKQILENLKDFATHEGESRNQEYRWNYATIANCHYGLGDNELGQKYEEMFISVTNTTWELDTYNTNKSQLIELLEK